MTSINVVGAYGRTYDSIVSAKNDWDNGLDFKIVGGAYINKSDWRSYAKDDSVVYEDSRSDWMLQERYNEDYWDKQEQLEELVKAFKKVQENG